MPFLALIVAVTLAWGWGLTWLNVGLAADLVRPGQVDISARLIWILEKLAGLWTFAGRHRNVWPA